MGELKLSRRTQIILAVCLIFALLLAAYIIIKLPSNGILPGETTENVVPAAGESVEIHFIDVGQGDGILIRTREGDVVIDAGPSGSEEDYVAYLKSVGVKTVEYLVLTHPHNDHIGGADHLLEELDVKRVIMPNTNCTTSIYLKVVNLIKKCKAELIYPKVNEVITLGGLKLTTLAPISIEYDNYNDYSVVMRADFGESSFLFVGDAEAVSEKEMLKTIPSSLLDVDVLKVGHHGSKTSSTEDFLKELSPEYAIISCGADNSFGHPHSVILDRFALIEKAGKLYRTDEDGHIIVTSNGEKLEIRTGR